MLSLHLIHRLTVWFGMRIDGAFRGDLSEGGVGREGVNERIHIIVQYYVVQNDVSYDVPIRHSHYCFV